MTAKTWLSLLRDLIQVNLKLNQISDKLTHLTAREGIQLNTRTQPLQLIFISIFLSRDIETVLILLHECVRLDPKINSVEKFSFTLNGSSAASAALFMSHSASVRGNTPVSWAVPHPILWPYFDPCPSTTRKSPQVYSLLKTQEQVKPSPSRVERLRWNIDIGPQKYSCPVKKRKKPPFITLIETEATFISNKTVLVHYKYSPSFHQMSSIIHPYCPFFPSSFNAPQTLSFLFYLFERIISGFYETVL